MLLATLLVALGCRDGGPSPAPRPPGGTITSLSEADTILVTDLTGTLLAETSGTGKVKARFAAYPFGVARRDESEESHQYAASPRDDAVALDHMGSSPPISPRPIPMPTRARARCWLRTETATSGTWRSAPRWAR